MGLRNRLAQAAQARASANMRAARKQAVRRLRGESTASTVGRIRADIKPAR